MAIKNKDDNIIKAKLKKLNDQKIKLNINKHRVLKFEQKYKFITKLLNNRMLDMDIITF